MVFMNETHMVGRQKVSLPEYTCWSKNCKEKGGGGESTAVSQEYKDSAMGAGEGQDEDEYIITRIDRFNPALNVINCYGEQRKIKKEEMEEKWERLRRDMEDIRTRNEFCLLAGDLNKLVGCDEWGVPGNNQEVSPGGRLLRVLLASKIGFLSMHWSTK